MTRCRTALLAMLALPACTTFTTVRPAQVQPGLQFHLQATAAAPPGELPGWMWSMYCAEGCNRPLAGMEMGVFHGVADSTRAYYVGGGLNAPVAPFVEGYWQLARKPNARGLGARLGLPVAAPAEVRIFYRHDIGASLATNTNVVMATGRSPNGANAATFLALVQGIGFVHRSPRSTSVLGFSAGVTHTARNRYGDREAAVGFLGTASLGWEFHRRTPR